MADAIQQQAQQQGQQQGTEAKADQNRFVINVVAKLVPSTKVGWIVYVIIAAIIISLAYKGYLNFLLSLKSLIYYGLIVAFFIFVGYGFAGAIKGDKEKLFISFALIIWALDLVPYIKIPLIGQISLGPTYAGFKFDLQGTLDTDLVAVATSFIVFLFLYFNMLKNIIEHEYKRFLLSFVFILVMNHFITGKKLFGIIPLKIPFTIPYGTYIYLGLAVAALIVLFLLRKKLGIDEIPYLFSYLFMVYVFSFFWINNGWVANFKAILHATFIAVFGFAYIAKKEEDNPVAWHILVPSLLILDFYGYGFLFNSDILILKFIPLFLIFVIAYCYYKTSSNFALVSFMILTTVFVIFSFQAYGYEYGAVRYETNQGETYNSFLTEFYTKLGSVGTTIERSIGDRIDYATGGLYRGAVEKNRYESLGVYFSNIRASDPRFYSDEPITVWSSIRSKTYKDAVVINFSCYRWKDDNKKRIGADKIVPNIKFPIFTLEEVDTECTFLPPKRGEKSKDIPVGSNTITLSAEYNFGTDAYLKTYFMDRSRFRAYARENLDIFTELGIKDKNPHAVFTNGPVEIGMGTGEPLILVSEGYAIKPVIGFSLNNRQEILDKDKRIITRWEGKIKNITELVILVPPGIEIANTDDCYSEDNTKKLNCPCNMPFREYTPEKCVFACDEQVWSPCLNACKGAFKNENEQIECIGECDTTYKNCKKECDFIFKVDQGEGSADEKYKGYMLDVGSIKFRDLNKDIDKYLTFQCRFDPSTKVLDANPITTRYFRVRARYNYLLENPVIVNVEQPPTMPLTTQDSVSKIASEAENKYPFGFDKDISLPDLATAIAVVESGQKHCCQEGYKQPDRSGKGGTTCYRSEENRCPPHLTRSSGTSYGIMQIRYDTEKVKNEVNQRVARLCGGETIYDFDCNVKVGIDILYEKKGIAPNGCRETTIYKSQDKIKYKTFIDACENGASAGVPAISGKPYSSYTGVEATLRGYNGWGRDKPNEKDRFDEEYVEKVMDAYNKIKGSKIIDETGIKSLLESRTGEGMTPEVEDATTATEQQAQPTQLTAQKPSPPRSASAIDTVGTGRSITIYWDTSETPDIKTYRVYRFRRIYDAEISADTVQREKYYDTPNLNYIDTEVEEGVEYYYGIAALKTNKEETDFIESDYKWTEVVRSVDDFKS